MIATCIQFYMNVIKGIAGKTTTDEGICLKYVVKLTK